MILLMSIPPVVVAVVGLVAMVLSDKMPTQGQYKNGDGRAGEVGDAAAELGEQC